MILAEELDADWRRATFEHAQAKKRWADFVCPADIQ
jgi:hypothetical protein